MKIYQGITPEMFVKMNKLVLFFGGNICNRNQTFPAYGGVIAGTAHGYIFRDSRKCRFIAMAAPVINEMNIAVQSQKTNHVSGVINSQQTHFSSNGTAAGFHGPFTVFFINPVVGLKFEVVTRGFTADVCGIAGQD